MSQPLQLLQTRQHADEDFRLDEMVAALRSARKEWREKHRRHESRVRELPSAEALSDILQGLRGVLFPLRLGPPELRLEAEDFYVGHTLETQLRALRQQILLELRYAARLQQTHAALEQKAQAIAAEFAYALADVRRLLDSDVLAAFEGDPAARSVDEVLLCYPGVEAMIHHRLAHRLHGLGVPLLARLVAELAHAKTGIDIHSGAQIGAGFFIDHGTGVVIGETAVIGERVRIYQAVTLGARSFPTDENGHITKGAPRHPIVEDDVTIYAGATILGRITLGRGSTIGGNVWLTRSVAPGSHVTQAGLQHEQLQAGS